MTAHNALIRGLLEDAIAKRGREHLRGRLLDVGCGTKRYAPLFAGVVAEHVGLDHAETLHGLENVDVVATAYDIPMRNASFDSVLCTEVLEHLEEPSAALAESFRILKPGGRVLYTSPFIWHLHEEPRDFYRYSSHGLRHLFTKAGYEIVEIAPLNGFWATFGQLLCYTLVTYDRGAIQVTRVIPLATRIIQRLAGFLDKRSPRPAWTSHFIVVARKPEESP